MSNQQDDDEARERLARAAIARGDWDAALNELMRLYGRRLYSKCCRMLGNKALAEDALQETYIQALRDLQRAEVRSTLGRYLCGIAAHRCLDVLRKGKRDPEPLDDDLPMPHAPTPTPWPGCAPSGDPETALRGARFSDKLEHCMGRLSAKTRVAFELSKVQGFSYREMQDQLGETAATLSMRVSRALKHVRRCLVECGVEL